MFGIITLFSCNQNQSTKTTETNSEQLEISACDMIKQDKDSMVMVKNTNLRNVSWCEVILWCGAGGTFNTMGLNDPKDSAPLELYKKLDKAKMAEKYQATAVSFNPDNGRRFWTCDEFHIESSTTIRDFEGLKARYVGNLEPRPDGSPQNLSAETISFIMYKVKSFLRVSTLIYNADKPVFLLQDTEGTTWINKTYQTGMDSTLTIEGMATLDSRLKHLPEGWSFRSVVLTADLILKANGEQRIMWDELGGAWDALEPGTFNYMPK
jgi:hypothetical protein